MVPAPAMYNDFSGLAQLRASAARSDPEAALEAARQFEALFVQMMLKSMRSAGSVLGEQRDTTYEEMFDQQVAMEITRQRGLGLADLLMRQLGNATGRIEAEQQMPAGQPSAAGPVATSRGSDWRPGSPAEFVREIWPLARQAAQRLNVDPRALVAQAALETGWGSRMIRDEGGRNSNNLFGIKADRRWSGPSVAVRTIEYRGELPQPERAQFRAYPSLRAAFDDYVNFLTSNPRYADALTQTADAGRFARALQEAGYATDPRYAQKIERIMAGPQLREALAQIGPSGEVNTEAS